MSRAWSGRAAWTRLTPAAALATTNHPGPIRTTPVTLLPRGERAALEARRACTVGLPCRELSSRAQAVANYLRAGWSFFDEIVRGMGWLRTHVEDALAELVALGLVELGQLRRPARAAHPIG